MSEVRADGRRVQLAGTVFSEAELEATLRFARGVEGVALLEHQVHVSKVPAR